MDTINNLFNKLKYFHEEIEITFSEIIETPWRKTRKIEWEPLLDIHENDDEYIITADLPGIKPPHIELFKKNLQLTICGERRLSSVHRAKNNKFILLERPQGYFCRTIELEENVNLDQAMINDQDGIISITIPKVKTQKGKTDASQHMSFF